MDTFLKLSLYFKMLDELMHIGAAASHALANGCLLYTSPSPRDLSTSRMPSSA